MSRPGKTSSRCCENSVSIDIKSSKWPCLGQSFTIQILPSRSIICALISPTFSFIRTSTGRWPSRICCRISGTHFGHSESVERGQPSGGFDFSHDLSKGLSDHLGVGETFGLTRFSRSNTAHAPVAATVTAFSTYLIGLCIRSRFPQFEVPAIFNSKSLQSSALNAKSPKVQMCGSAHTDPIESASLRH